MEKHHFSGQDEYTHYLMANDYAYTLKDTGSMDVELRNILQKMIDGFTEKNPNITITLTSEADAATVLKTRFTKDDMKEITLAVTEHINNK